MGSGLLGFFDLPNIQEPLPLFLYSSYITLSGKNLPVKKNAKKRNYMKKSSLQTDTSVI